MNGFDEYYDAPHDQLDDDPLLNSGPVPTTGDGLDPTPPTFPSERGGVLPHPREDTEPLPDRPGAISEETMPAQRDTVVHDVRPRSSGRPSSDIEALRARVAILRAALAFPDGEQLVDQDGPLVDAQIPDWAEVEQVISGLRRCGASTAARRAAVQRLTRCGLSAREIGQRIGMT